MKWQTATRHRDKLACLLSYRHSTQYNVHIILMKLKAYHCYPYGLPIKVCHNFCIQNEISCSVWVINDNPSLIPTCDNIEQSWRVEQSTPNMDNKCNIISLVCIIILHKSYTIVQRFFLFFFLQTVQVKLLLNSTTGN